MDFRFSVITGENHFFRTTLQYINFVLHVTRRVQGMRHSTIIVYFYSTDGYLTF